MKNQSIPQQNLFRFALKVATAQIASVLICAVVLFFVKGLPVALSLFAGSLASVVPFLAFAAILISAGFSNSGKIALRFFVGVFLKFILSAAMLWCAYFYIHLQLFALLAGFILAYFILLCLPKAKWLQLRTPVINNGARA